MTGQVDASLGAAKELSDLASPVTGLAKSAGKGLWGAWQDRKEKKRQKNQAKENAKEGVKAQVPWYRRILRALGDKSESFGGVFGGLSSLFGMGGGGGLFSSLLGGAGAGGVGGLLARAGGAKGLLKGALGKALLPLTAIVSAVKSFNTSTDDYAKRYGIKAGESVAKDILARTVGLLQDMGNDVTFGLADRFGNWLQGDGFVRSDQYKDPNPTDPRASASGSAATGKGAAVGDRLMADLMRDYQLTREQAAGMVGNLSHESGGFQSLQEKNPTVAGSKGGYGYAQWTGARRVAFEGWAKAKGLDPTSYEANYGFLRHELDNTREGAFLPALRNAGTAADAARVVSNRYLRPGTPHMDSRVARANELLSRQGRAAVAGAPSMPVRPSAAPSVAQLQIPPPPPLSAQIGSNGRASGSVEVTLPERLSQGLSDRGVANLATGGMSGQNGRMH